MAILGIAPVSRTGMRFLISLYGLSESGKTLSALKLAAGIQPDPKRRMLLDTEGGQRGRAFADHIDGGYMYGRLTPPFTPERYIEALDEIEQAGVTVLTIDSVSHAWFAEGGVLDMVENATEKNDMAKWAKPKRRLGKMTRRMLSSDMHIILCSRAKQPLIEEMVDGRKKLIPGPVVPIQEKTLRFDMTIMAQMLGDGRFTVTAPAGKCPGALREIFAHSAVMNEEMGRQLIAWLGAENAKSPEQRALETEANDCAERGSEAMRGFWSRLTKEQRGMLAAKVANYQSIAKAADAEAERAATEAKERQANGEAGDQLDDPFGKVAESKPALTGVEHAGEKPAATPHDPATGEVKHPPAEPPATDWPALYQQLLEGARDCRSKPEMDEYANANQRDVAALRKGDAKLADKLAGEMKAIVGSRAAA